MRQTMVSSAQSPKFVCVRQKRFLKGLLQNARHFATAPFKNVFASTQANFGLYAPEAMICLMASFLNERFLRSGDAKHIAHINQIGIFQSVKPHKRRHRCAKSLGNLPERIAPADGIGFIRNRLYHAYT